MSFRSFLLLFQGPQTVNWVRQQTKRGRSPSKRGTASHRLQKFYFEAKKLKGMLNVEYAEKENRSDALMFRSY